MDELSPAVQADLQKAFKETKALIIDKKGMIELGRLKQIDSTLKDIRLDYANQAFGGLTIILAGNFRQLLTLEIFQAIHRAEEL